MKKYKKEARADARAPINDNHVRLLKVYQDDPACAIVPYCIAGHRFSYDNDDKCVDCGYLAHEACLHLEDLVYLPNEKTHISTLFCRLCQLLRDRDAIDEAVKKGALASSNSFYAGENSAYWRGRLDERKAQAFKLPDELAVACRQVFGLKSTGKLKTVVRFLLLAINLQRVYRFDLRAYGKAVRALKKSRRFKISRYVPMARTRVCVRPLRQRQPRLSPAVAIAYCADAKVIPNCCALHAHQAAFATYD
jgi:hypothetical protein